MCKFQKIRQIKIRKTFFFFQNKFICDILICGVENVMSVLEK